MSLSCFLLSLYAFKHMSINQNFAFYSACQNGQLSAAQTIYQINPSIDISADDEYAFRRACLKGNKQVAQWFVSIRPYHYEITMLKNGKWNWRIRTKKEAKEARWQNIKYAVWAASDASPNRNSLLYKLPFDVSKQIIQFVWIMEATFFGENSLSNPL